MEKETAELQRLKSHLSEDEQKLWFAAGEYLIWQGNPPPASYHNRKFDQTKLIV